VRKNKNIISAVILLVVGLGLLVTGPTSLTGDVKCGNQVMHRGQICADIGGGGGHRNYDQQKSKNEQSGWIETILGALFAVGGGTWLGLQIRDRRRAASATPPAQP
jgi:hypothetical protein